MMCEEVIFRGSRIETIGALHDALGSEGTIVADSSCGYTDADMLPHECLCPVDLRRTAEKNRLRLWPSCEGEGIWIMSDDDSHPDQGRYARLEMGGRPIGKCVLDVPRASIECQCIDGVWYWGASFMTTHGGEGFAALPNWQHQADTKEEAILAAATYMRSRIERSALWKEHGEKVLRWLDEIEQTRQGELFSEE